MNTAWFFGDSFTYGFGCKPGEHFYEQYPELRAKTWTQIIANEFKFNEVNFGIPGNCNSIILKQILENISKFDKNDLVILTDTSPIRLPLPEFKTRKLSSFNPELLVWPVIHNQDYYREFINKFFISDKEQRVLVDFLYTFYMEYYEEWGDYYSNQLNSIAIHLNKLGISTYVWSWELWHLSNKFRTIEKATNGKIVDKHWDWEGHKNFATYLLKRIYTKDYLHKKDLI